MTKQDDQYKQLLHLVKLLWHKIKIKKNSNNTFEKIENLINVREDKSISIPSKIIVLEYITTNIIDGINNWFSLCSEFTNGKIAKKSLIKKIRKESCWINSQVEELLECARTTNEFAHFHQQLKRIMSPNESNLIINVIKNYELIKVKHRLRPISRSSF